MRSLIYPEFVRGRGALGLLILRLVVGSAFIQHGWGKIQHPFGWMNQPDQPAPVPGILQAAAALSEFGGGIAFIIGLLTPLAAIGIAATMATAIRMVHWEHPFVSSGAGPSFELPASYLAVAILLFLIGPGILSLDFLLFGRRQSGSPQPAAPEPLS
jgi:putative oxidoreductase